MFVGWGLPCKPITLSLHSKFQIFVTVVTGVGLRQIALRSYIWRLPTAPKLFGQESRTYLLYKSRVMANSRLKLSNFFVTMATGVV